MKCLLFLSIASAFHMKHIETSCILFITCYKEHYKKVLEEINRVNYVHHTTTPSKSGYTIYTTIIHK
jgi:hypothetical protein